MTVANESIPEIAEALGVDHVLEGSVRRGGDTLRITAQLIRAADGFHLWSATYHRTPDDIIAIQEDIALEIANALETAIDPEALAKMMSAGTRSVPAYEAYLTGRGSLRAAGESGDRYEVLEALDSFERAVELDPKFSSAYSLLSFFWSQQLSSNQITSGVTNLSHEEMKNRRDEALDNAIRYEQNDTIRTGLEGGKAWNAFDFQRALRLLTQHSAERPNDEDAFGGLIQLEAELGMRDDIAAQLKDRYEHFELTRQLANGALQVLRTSEDAVLMRIIAHEAIEKFSNDASLLYQAHRQLLWADEQRDFDTIADYLNYANFDPTPYANFMQFVSGQGIEDRVIVDLPYRCNR